MEDSFVIKDMKTFSKAVDMMHIDRMFETYPDLVCRIFEKMYRVEGIPRDKMLKLMRKEARGKIGTRQLLSDGFKIGRALL
jgi:electron transfer flavoprotein-quinone oxidoreductase